MASLHTVPHFPLGTVFLICMFLKEHFLVDGFQGRVLPFTFRTKSQILLGK